MFLITKNDKKDKKNQINELILSKDNKDKSEINSNINNDKYNKKSNNKIINIEKKGKLNLKHLGKLQMDLMGPILGMFVQKLVCLL